VDRNKGTYFAYMLGRESGGLRREIGSHVWYEARYESCGILFHDSGRRDNNEDLADDIQFKSERKHPGRTVRFNECGNINSSQRVLHLLPQYARRANAC
jgi:hypothetical protein